MDSRIESVELKIMDLEVIIEQLNQVVIRHENTIDVLSRKVADYQQQLQAHNSPIAPASEETPPPHY